MLPHRGFDYADSGYALYDTINIAHGIIPTTGYAGVINLPLYLLGLNYYLAYEIYYCLVAMFATFLLFYAFKKHRSVLLPVTMILVVTSVIIYILSYQLTPQYLFIIAVATFSSNILFWIESGYFATASELKPLLHTWSLAVEEQYYILFPLFLMIFWNLPKKYLLLLLALIFLLSLTPILSKEQ